MGMKIWTSGWINIIVFDTFLCASKSSPQPSHNHERTICIILFCIIIRNLACDGDEECWSTQSYRRWWCCVSSCHYFTWKIVEVSNQLEISSPPQTCTRWKQRCEYLRVDFKIIWRSARQSRFIFVRLSTEQEGNIIWMCEYAYYKKRRGWYECRKFWVALYIVETKTEICSEVVRIANDAAFQWLPHESRRELFEAAWSSHRCLQNCSASLGQARLVLDTQHRGRMFIIYRNRSRYVPENSGTKWRNPTSFLRDVSFRRSSLKRLKMSWP